MADTWDEGTAGLLLSDLPASVATPDVAADVTADVTAGKARKTPGRPAKSKDARMLRPAADRPVGRIAVDLPLAHLDRPFDYLVPERLPGRGRPGGPGPGKVARPRGGGL